MESTASLINVRNIVITILVLVLITVAALFFRSETQLSSTQPQASVPAPVSSDIISKDKPEAVPKTPTAITPEEKRIVAEKQQLQAIVDAGDRYKQQFEEDERRLKIKDQQGQQAIADLAAKVKGLSK